MTRKKQLNFFSPVVEKAPSGEIKYTSKIKAPIYKPKNRKPWPIELCDLVKTTKLIDEIKSSTLSNDEKIFLSHAAGRHTIFNYELVADYYASASKEMQILMEKSGLVIVDFEKSLEFGFSKLSDALLDIFLEEPENG